MTGKLAPISIALGAYGRNEALRDKIRALGRAPVDFAEITPISRAFAPMVRELRFDISEMALMTFLQARAYGKALSLLPVCVASRFQEAALLCKADDARITGPEEMRDKRIGVRFYGQTTAVWLRGILQDRFGIEPKAIRWVTFEAAHVAECVEPAWVRRAAPGADMVALLKSGALDAIIVGNDVPDDPALRTVFADPVAAGNAFYEAHGFAPINHVVVAATPFMQLERSFTNRFVDTLATHLAATRVADVRMRPSHGASVMQPSIDLALHYAFDQGLLPAPMTPAEVWE